MPIVAAVDRNERAAPIVREAARLGEAFGEAVEVVHVLARDEFVSLERTQVSETGETIPVDRVVEMAEAIAAEAIRDADVETAVGTEAVGLMGDPADEIVEYADEHGASYVVIGVRTRSPIGKALFGSVAQSVLLSASCPVVSLRMESDSESESE